MKSIKVIRKNLRLLLAIITIFSLVWAIPSCMFFYTMEKYDNTQESYKKMKKYNRKNYRFVLNTGDSLLGLKDVVLDENLITGNKRELNDTEVYYLEKVNDEKRTSRYKYRDASYIYQVQIFVKKYQQKNNSIEIKEEDIFKVNVYNKNIGLSTITNIGTGALITVSSMAIFLAIACNCPHVYTFDGATYNYTNTLFTGAISPKIERSDYKIMPDYFPDSDNYKFIIKNEENELQYTNLVELVVVEHDKNINVYSDQDGSIYTISKPIKPLSAIDDNSKDLLNLTAYNDQESFTFNKTGENDFSHLYASFEVPPQRNNAKLILKVKNSEWGSFVYNRFTQKFGWYYDNWVKNNQKKSREEMEQRIKEQGIPLVVSVKVNDEWVDIEEIDVVGGISYNTLSVPIDKSYLRNNTLEVRLRSGFMFWKLDYIAMDFSAPKEIDIKYLKPFVALGKHDIDYIKQIGSDDDQYMELEQIEHSAYIEFVDLPVNQNMERTILLHSKGYYVPQTKIKGKFELRNLVRFRNEAELSRYSKSLHKKYFDGLAINFQ